MSLKILIDYPETEIDYKKSKQENDVNSLRRYLYIQQISHCGCKYLNTMLRNNMTRPVCNARNSKPSEIAREDASLSNTRERVFTRARHCCQHPACNPARHLSTLLASSLNLAWIVSSASLVIPPLTFVTGDPERQVHDGYTSTDMNGTSLSW